MPNLPPLWSKLPVKVAVKSVVNQVVVQTTGQSSGRISGQPSVVVQSAVVWLVVAAHAEQRRSMGTWAVPEYPPRTHIRGTVETVLGDRGGPRGGYGPQVPTPYPHTRNRGSTRGNAVPTHVEPIYAVPALWPEAAIQGDVAKGGGRI